MRQLTAADKHRIYRCLIAFSADVSSVFKLLIQYFSKRYVSQTVSDLPVINLAVVVRYVRYIAKELFWHNWASMMEH